MLIGSDNQLVQLALVGGERAGGNNGGIIRNGAAYSQRHESDISAVEFDPRREVMYWIDSIERKIYRSALAKGNQTHEGQPLAIDFNSMNLSPLAIAVDYLTGF